MGIKVSSAGTVEERLARLEHAQNFSEVMLGFPMAEGDDLALDADLTAIAAVTGTGILCRTAATPTWALRTVTGGTGVTITNPGGVAGNIDVSLSLGAIDHNALLNLPTGDVHTHYALLAGRPSTTNDLLLSTSTTGSLTGSSASGSGLNLKSTSHSTKGQVNAVDELRLRTGLTSVATDSADTFLARGLLNSVTVDDDVVCNFIGLGLTGTLIQAITPILSVHGLFAAGTVNNPLTFQNASGVAAFPTLAALANFTTFKAITTNVTSGVLVSGVHAQVAMTRDSSTTMAGIDLRCINDVPTIGTGCTVDSRRTVVMANKSGSGTQTNAVCVDVADQTVGTLAAAVRSAITAGTGKWHLYLSGTASSYHNGNLLVGTSTDFASGTTHCKVAGGLSVGGDNSGVASHISLTGTSDTTANSTGIGTILFKGATNRNSTGFIKIYVGTTAYYVPFFAAITG